MERSTCKRCGQPIAFATYRELGSFEPDYDPSDDPRVWRHLNGYAACGLPGFAEPVSV